MRNLRSAVLGTLLALLPGFCFAAVPSASFEAYNVVWDTPSTRSADSMPVGGGGIGCNVWVENGDLLLYAQQSGAFDKNYEFNKMGRFRIRLSPNPFAAGGTFRQELKLRQGYVEITANHPSSGKVTVKVWTEINRPVVHVDVDAERRIRMSATYETWRYKDEPLPAQRVRPTTDRRASIYDFDGYLVDMDKKADVIEPGKHSIIWYTDNGTLFNAIDFAVGVEELEPVKAQLWDPLKNLISGGLMKGDNFEYSGASEGIYCQIPYKAWTYRSRTASKSHHLDIFGQVETSESPAPWKTKLAGIANAKQDRAKLQGETQAWWAQFWQRSYILVNPGKDASDRAWRLGRNYNLFRYQLGGNLNGKAPTKFNGGNLTYDVKWTWEKHADFPPDFRRWGGGTHTLANTRFLYWPMLKSGDFDLMFPLMEVYRTGLVNAMMRTKYYWGHGGCSFGEQVQFSGLPLASHYGFAENGYDWTVRPKDFEKGEQSNFAVSTLYNGELEIAYMMLEYHRFSGDDITPYLPFIHACVQFYDEHYRMINKRRTGKELNDEGKLVFYPTTPGESKLNSTNAADIISGLTAVLVTLLEMKELPLTPEQRNYYAEVLARTPDLPIAKKVVDGRERTFLKISLFDDRTVSGFFMNMYATFPYDRIYKGSDRFDWAYDTWTLNMPKSAKEAYIGHRPGVIYSARLGLTDEAKSTISNKLDDSKTTRFPTFWGPGFDWGPDHNWGGGAMIGLQEMLMQTPGKTIRLMPAWPKDWDAEFKLNAPYNTTVEGRIVSGQLVDLKVTPPERMKDVVR